MRCRGAQESQRELRVSIGVKSNLFTSRGSRGVNISINYFTFEAHCNMISISGRGRKGGSESEGVRGKVRMAQIHSKLLVDLTIVVQI